MASEPHLAPGGRVIIRDPHVAQFGTSTLPPAWDVHYLTRHLTIACQPGRDLDGAPLNTADKRLVTCPQCKDAIQQPT